VERKAQRPKISQPKMRTIKETNTEMVNAGLLNEKAGNGMLLL
jgi:hypothetical protein